MVRVDVENGNGKYHSEEVATGTIYVHGQKSVIIDIEDGKIVQVSVFTNDGEDPIMEQTIEL